MTAVLPLSEAQTCRGALPVAPALAEAEAVRLARVLKAVADPNRLRLLSLLVGSVGLVERETRGVWRFYRVVPEALAGLGVLFTTGPVAVKA